MKCVTISEKTAVGCKKITYEVPDEVADFAIQVLEGVVPVPAPAVADAEPAPEQY